MLLGMCLLSLIVNAQDSLPGEEISLIAHVPTKKSKNLGDVGFVSDTIPLRMYFPAVFTGMATNCIIDSAGQLDGVMETLRLIQADVLSDSLRIVHIGDSHVRGRIYPQTAGKHLSATFSGIQYMDMGVNGATCLTFTHAERVEAISRLKPDLLILSFGTNESHNRNYSTGTHYWQLDELVKLLRFHLPNVPILLTTPPGSYVYVRKQKRRIYSVNPRTAMAAGTICRYAADHQLAVWDMYSIVGGTRKACINWKAARMIRPDYVHFNTEGYTLQGELLYDALVKVYNQYVSTASQGAEVTSVSELEVDERL